MDFIKIIGTTCIVLLVGFSPMIIGYFRRKIKNFYNYQEKLKPKICFSSYKEEDPYLIFPKPPKKPEFEMINRDGCRLNYKNILGIFWIFEEKKWILIGEYSSWEYNCKVIIELNDNYYLAKVNENRDIELDGFPKNTAARVIGKVIYESSFE